MIHAIDPEISAFIDELAEAGSHYRIEQMERLYTEDLGFLVFTSMGDIARLSKAEMITEFRNRRDAGDPPLSTEKRILHVEVQGETATAILYRRMSAQADAALYELRMRKANGRWQVSGETVLPWPERPSIRGFLPPRPSSAQQGPANRRGA